MPTALRSGSGATVTDVDGNVFIDCLGLILETGGRHNSALRLLPPLVISRDELDQVVDILAHCFKKVSDNLRPHSI